MESILSASLWVVESVPNIRDLEVRPYRLLTFRYLNALSSLAVSNLLKVTLKIYWEAYLKLVNLLVIGNDFHIFPFSVTMTVSQAG